LDNNKPICDKNGNSIIFDIIISNPPYVTESDKSRMQSNVIDYEPHGALFVSNSNPLVYYSAIIQFAKKQLKPGGRIYFEINESLGNKMITLLGNNSFTNIKLIKDLSNKDRFISTQLPLIPHQQISNQRRLVDD
jgi:release factor glutamine methyltransferase